MPKIEKIYGPPGAGKTTRLISIVSNELATGVLPSQIVYVSFTKVAAKVAKDRILERYPKYTKDDFQYFSTVHSICFKLLDLSKDNIFIGKEVEKFGKVYNYNFSTFRQSEYDLFAQALQDAALSATYDYYEAFYYYWKNSRLKFDDAVRMFVQNEIPIGFNRDELITYIRRREEYKRRNGLSDFPDMLINVIQHNLVPLGAKVLFIDEAQDNFPLLWDVLKIWMKHVNNVYIAGDPYQCIYGWSGADPSIFINIAADKTRTLKRSYRCPRKVHDLGRKVVDRLKLRYDDDDFTPRDADGKIMRSINFDLIDEPTFWLFRTRSLLNEVYDDLYLKGIPFNTRRGKVNIFNRMMENKRKVVINLLNLHNKPIQLIDLGSIIDYVPSKIGEKVLIEKGSKKKIKEDIKVFPEAYVSWRNLEALGFTNAFTEHCGIALLELLTTREFSSEEKNYIRTIVSKYGVSVLQEIPKLELGTLHSVKGDEAVRVIIDPTYTRTPYNNYMSGNDEEHRLIYTGITRSSRDVVIMPPSKLNNYPI